MILFLYLIRLTYGSFSGNYDFDDAFQEYKSILYTMQDNPNPQDVIIKKIIPFPNKYKIINAIEFQNPKIREFSIRAINKHFKNFKTKKKYKTYIQCFAVFKEINNNWNYVSGPKGYDYIANASESIKYLSGNCVEHSIFMVSCIKSVGGITRLVHTDGHIYPELLIGTQNDFKYLNNIIKNKLFIKETIGNELHFHVDERKNIWLNLDYTARYPGGAFYEQEILSTLTF